MKLPKEIFGVVFTAQSEKDSVNILFKDLDADHRVRIILFFKAYLDFYICQRNR